MGVVNNSGGISLPKGSLVVKSPGDSDGMNAGLVRFFKVAKGVGDHDRSGGFGFGLFESHINLCHFTMSNIIAQNVGKEII